MEKVFVAEIMDQIENQTLNYEELQELEEVIIPASGGDCGAFPGYGIGCGNLCY